MLFNFRKKIYKYILTIDVEIDASASWKTSSPASFEGVLKGIPKLQDLCDKYGVKPTYLLSPAVLFDKDCIELFKSLNLNNCELGTHLHGEYIGPKAKYSPPDFSGCDPGEMQCQYSEELEFEKLKTLTNHFQDTFGYSPKSFRAGRFGARGWTIKSLEQLGYTHDSSVTPGRNWYNIADYSSCKKLSPYHPSSEDICKEGNSKIIEVPVTITKNLEWLRPTPGFSNFSKTKKVIRYASSSSKNVVHLCSMFHNVELIPNKSPYCKTDKDCEILMHTLEETFKLLVKKNTKFLTLKEVEIDKC